MARAAAGLSADSLYKGVYFTINPLDPALLSRSPNAVRTLRGGEAAKDADVVRRRWLLIDLDPVRPGAVSSTDAEKAATGARAREVRDHLAVLAGRQPLRGRDRRDGDVDDRLLRLRYLRGMHQRPPLKADPDWWPGLSK